ncbi:MAG: hypothetical protein OEW21_15140 [Betaproteobacteria bacterium]|nr:hypothetical protein [Betaproteobacteria bacterium]
MFAALKKLANRLAPVGDTDFPVFIVKGQARFARSTGPSRERVFVVSLPKSGTYLIAEILGLLGLANTGVHMSESGFSDYRPIAIAHDNSDDSLPPHQFPLHKAIRLMMPGQFAVGHLGYSDYVIDCLSEFRVLVSKRELRGALVSHMRFFMHPRRGAKHGSAWKAIDNDTKRMEVFMGLWAQELIAWYRSISPWTRDRSGLTVRFEDLLGSNGEEAQLQLLRAIAEKAGLDATDTRLLQAVGLAKAAKTLTKSETASTVGQFWSTECERIFLDAGGGKLNEYLGYPAPL